MKYNYKLLALLFFIYAVSLRILLWWANPTDNAFDNHFEPILLMMKYGTIPAKDACLQCYHPPVFYGISAMVGNISLKMGINHYNMLKLLQFIPCLYGILTVGIIFSILNKLYLSDFAKLLAFGTICFLPRHIYMSAMNSNDTISYLFVALSIYLLIITIERKFSYIMSMILSVVITITLFTKYTSFVILPVVLFVFLWTFFKRIDLDKKKITVSLFLVLFLPISTLSIYASLNVKNYGSPLPWNLKMIDPSHSQPRDQGLVNFFTFKPWESIKTPFLTPGKLNSFWTLIYSGMWFDTEPKFIYYLDDNNAWWDHYYSWLRGERAFPGNNPSMSRVTILTGSSLITLGLLPLFFIILGIFVYFRRQRAVVGQSGYLDSVKLVIFPVLLISNAAGIVAITLRLPVYSAMKASYFLNSMPAFAVFLGIGLMVIENNHILKKITGIIFGALFIVTSLHIIHISLALRNIF